MIIHSEHNAFEIATAATTDLPLLTADLPGIGGKIKHSPDDFQVEEIPAYQPSGQGEHLFLWIEKRDTSAEQLTRHLSRVLRISPRNVGVAGLKDRRAVTRQYVSVPVRCSDQVDNLNTDRICVLRAVLHRNKLKTGHLRGNRFSILVRKPCDGAADVATPVCEIIGKRGFPNYYDDQRFGLNSETLRTGRALLSGRQKPADLPISRRRFLLRLSISAVQSFLLNRILAERLTDGLLHTVLLGDVLQVVESGGMFRAEDIAAEQRRVDAGEISITGPMFGPKMAAATGEPAEREDRVLRECGLSSDVFVPFRKVARGTRRPFTVRTGELCVRPEKEGLRFQFTLPSGSYATMLLREFQKTTD